MRGGSFGSGGWLSHVLVVREGRLRTRKNGRSHKEIRLGPDPGCDSVGRSVSTNRQTAAIAPAPVWRPARGSPQPPAASKDPHRVPNAQTTASWSAGSPQRAELPRSTRATESAWAISGFGAVSAFFGAGCETISSVSCESPNMRWA